ncbi:MAG: BON domain-containing protein [Promethearchaeia archaeon]
MNSEEADQIKKEIQDHLLWDPRIDESNIEISVTKEFIKLSGSVPSHPQKVYAEVAAKEVGDKPKIVNEIEVIFSPEFKTPNDNEIKTGLKKIFDINSCLEARKIEVTVNQGKVLLKGIVNSYWEKKMAEKLGSEIPGIKSIENQLTVKPPETLSDEEIAEEIQGALKRSLRVDSEKVDIEVKDGIVTLSGTVGSLSAYSAAEKAAKLSKSVIDVQNNLNYILRYDIT